MLFSVDHIFKFFVSFPRWNMSPQSCETIPLLPSFLKNKYPSLYYSFVTLVILFISLKLYKSSLSSSPVSLSPPLFLFNSTKCTLLHLSHGFKCGWWKINDFSFSFPGSYSCVWSTLNVYFLKSTVGRSLQISQASFLGDFLVKSFNIEKWNWIRMHITQKSVTLLKYPINELIFVI